MKKIMPFLTALLMAAAAKAQTSRELRGKWQLVKLTQNGMEKDILHTLNPIKYTGLLPKTGSSREKLAIKAAKANGSYLKTIRS